MVQPAPLRAKVANELIAYTAELLGTNSRPGIVVSFTPDDAANKLVLSNSNAFFVCCDI